MPSFQRKVFSAEAKAEVPVNMTCQGHADSSCDVELSLETAFLCKGTYHKVHVSDKLHVSLHTIGRCFYCECARVAGWSKDFKQRKIDKSEGICKATLECMQPAIAGLRTCAEHHKMQYNRGMFDWIHLNDFADYVTVVEGQISRKIKDLKIDKAAAYERLHQTPLHEILGPLATCHNSRGLVVYEDTEFIQHCLVAHVCLYQADGTVLLNCVIDYGMTFDQMVSQMLPKNMSTLSRAIAMSTLSRYYGDTQSAFTKDTKRMTPRQVVDELLRLKIKNYYIVEWSSHNLDSNWLKWLCNRVDEPAEKVLPPPWKCLTVMYAVWKQFRLDHATLMALYGVLFPGDCLVKIHHTAKVDAYKLWRICDLIFRIKGTKQTKIPFPFIARAATAA